MTEEVLCDFCLTRPSFKTTWHAGRTKQICEKCANRGPDPIRRTGPRVKRNDPCPCGSGKKYKKCHGGPPPKRRRPVQRPRVEGATVTPVQAEPVADNDSAATAAAMRQTGVRPEIAYAYEQTGNFITDMNRPTFTEEEQQAWDDAVSKYREEHSEPSSEEG